MQKKLGSLWRKQDPNTFGEENNSSKPQNPCWNQLLPICMEILRMLNEINFMSNRDSGKTLKEVLDLGKGGFWDSLLTSRFRLPHGPVGSPCVLSWWLRFATVLTSVATSLFRDFRVRRSLLRFWKPSGGAWSIGSIGLLLLGVVWLSGNLRNIAHIPQMK